MSGHYVGTELDLFAEAHCWKSYVACMVRPWLGPRVLDVGAGIGGNIPTLFHHPVQEWVALEPDPTLAKRIESASRVEIGTLDALPPSEKFDAILYMDVLEHIENDAAELSRAARYLTPGGRLIVLVPAHQFLFSPFDSSIGHFRRYDGAMLRRAGPREVPPDLLIELDSVGLLASLANRLLLRSAHPTPGQIRFWDRTLVPLSRGLDQLVRYRLGKSILAIWSVP
jgi:SAM-dependent methyltransferase